MKYLAFDAPMATCWSLSGAVEYKGKSYSFWAELEGVMDELTIEFNKDEPDSAFDFEEHERDVRAMFEDYHQFCEAHDLPTNYGL